MVISKDNGLKILPSSINQYITLTEEIEQVMAEAQKSLYRVKYQGKHRDEMTDEEWDNLMKEDDEIIKFYEEQLNQIEPPTCLKEGKQITTLEVTKDKRLLIIPARRGKPMRTIPKGGITIKDNWSHFIVDITDRLRGMSIAQIKKQYPHYHVQEISKDKKNIPRRLMQQFRLNIGRICPGCGEMFTGRPNKKYCNKWACRKRIQRKKIKNNVE
jgi:hypothetical protein